MTFIIKSKHFIYKLLGVYENWTEIANRYYGEREKMYQQFFKNKKVLDVGCGRGEFLNTLMEKYGCKCTGLDASRNMIYHAIQNNSVHDYIIGDSASLPFVDDAVDVIHFSHVFHHLPFDIQEKVLKESKRVAKDVVMINDSVNWENGLKRFLATIFWKVTDGGYIYRTETEWKKFLENEDMIDYSLGSYLMRQCFFVIKANTEKDT